MHEEFLANLLSKHEITSLKPYNFCKYLFWKKFIDFFSHVEHDFPGFEAALICYNLPNFRSSWCMMNF